MITDEFVTYLRQLAAKAAPIGSPPSTSWTDEDTAYLAAATPTLLDELDRLRAIVADVGRPISETEPDLRLLAALASGKGGRRTGVLHQLGYLEWTVTEAGHAALKAAGYEP